MSNCLAVKSKLNRWKFR